VSIQTGALKYAEGSALIELGNTRIMCAATVQDSVPPFLRNTDQGWVTAEYAMLPRATETRSEREGARGRGRGRSQEIQRLIGRSLRAVVDLEKLGPRTVVIDCDVIQAGGGTRCASITGGFVALCLAVQWLREKRLIDVDPVREYLAAVSVGRVDGKNLLDLEYSEDSSAEVDCNLVMTESGKLVEIQGTAEHEPFSRQELYRMIVLGEKGVHELIKAQRKALAP
jgi:ribonuclease PH